MDIVEKGVGQTIWIGEVCVTVVRIRGGKVRLGFDVPDGMVVLRQEVADREKEGGTGC